MALLLLGSAAPGFAQATAKLQPAAELKEGMPEAPLPRVMGTLRMFADRGTPGRIFVRVWRTKTKYGECGGDDEALGEAALTCPRDAMIVSVWWDLENASPFKLWHTPSRMEWRLPKRPQEQQPNRSTIWVDLEACEASADVDEGRRNPSADDTWRYMPYRVTVTDPDYVRFERLPPPPAPEKCMGWN